MTNDEVLAAINAKVLADPLFDALVSDRRDTEITAALNADSTSYTLRSHQITERGVMAAIGVENGEALLAALEAFAASTLPPEHPLASKHAGIKRMLGWLKTDAGLDIGGAEAQQLLGVLGQLGVINATHAGVIAALARNAVRPFNQDQVGYVLNRRVV